MVLRKLKTWALGSVNYELRRRAAGKSLRVPVINNIGRAHLDEHEPHLDVVLRRLYRPETLLIDVGVNIGQTLLKYAAIAGPACRYIGFEPNTRAASYVEEIIIRNDMRNALIVPVGLGSHTCLAKLFMASADSTDPAASMQQEVRDAEFYGAQKTVPVFNGDLVLEELGVSEGHLIFKIDVEGAELEVLRGLERSIKRLRPLIILEILPPSYFSQSVNDYRLAKAEELKRHLMDRAYSMQAIGNDGELASGVSPTGDYLFVPHEKWSSVRESRIEIGLSKQ